MTTWEKWVKDKMPEGSKRQEFIKLMVDAKDPLVQTICVRMIKRSNDGVKKYGDTMITANKDIIEWLDNAIEESLDQAVYLEKAKRMLEDMKKWNGK